MASVLFIFAIVTAIVFLVSFIITIVLSSVVRNRVNLSEAKQRLLASLILKGVGLALSIVAGFFGVLYGLRKKKSWGIIFLVTSLIVLGAFITSAALEIILSRDDSIGDSNQSSLIAATVFNGIGLASVIVFALVIYFYARAKVRLA